MALMHPRMAELPADQQRLVTAAFLVLGLTAPYAAKSGAVPLLDATKWIADTLALVLEVDESDILSTSLAISTVYSLMMIAPNVPRQTAFDEVMHALLNAEYERPGNPTDPDNLTDPGDLPGPFGDFFRGLDDDEF